MAKKQNLIFILIYSLFLVGFTSLAFLKYFQSEEKTIDWTSILFALTQGILLYREIKEYFKHYPNYENQHDK